MKQYTYEEMDNLLNNERNKRVERMKKEIHNYSVAKCSQNNNNTNKKDN